MSLDLRESFGGINMCNMVLHVHYTKCFRMTLTFSNKIFSSVDNPYALNILPFPYKSIINHS